MKKLLFIAAMGLLALSCKKEESKEAMEPQALRVDQEDTTEVNKGMKFTLYSNKVPYFFNRPDKNGNFHADKCTTNTTIFYEEYVDPTKIVQGVPFGGYTYQASFNSTYAKGDTISIKCEYEGKKAIGTSSKEWNALAIVRTKDLK